MSIQEIRAPFRDRVVVVLVTALINISLFLSIPLLSETKKPRVEDVEWAMVVSFDKPPDPKEILREQEIKKEPERPKDQLPEKAAFFEKESRPEQINMDFEVPEFEIPLDLDVDQGMAVGAPGQSAAQRALQAARTAFEMDEVDRPPQVLRKIPPVYPHDALKKRIEGMLVLRFLVNEVGKVEDISVVRADPKGIFEQRAVEAISKWRFKPGIFEGKPVPTWVVIPIQFKP